MLVVEAVLRAGNRQQHILLHRSLDGRVVRGEPDATVIVTTDQGQQVRYEEASLFNCLLSDPANWDLDEPVEVEASCYISPREAGRFVQPGRSYELRIDTSDGLLVRGRTTLPGAFAFRSPTVDVDPINLVGECRFPSKVFDMVWTRAAGAWSYVVSMEITGLAPMLDPLGVEAPDPLELTSVSVSSSDTTLVFPTNVGLFQRGDLDQEVFALLEDGLPAGTDATFVVLAAEKNYTNGIRGGRFNPSGNVRLSSVAGDGVGVFGGVVPLVIRSATGPGGPPPPCEVR